jgi:hypothetical protein
MTASEAIARAKETRQGAIDYSQFLKWVNVIEGRIQVEIMGKRPEEVIIYTEENDNVPLLVSHPYDEVYVYYLCAMIDFFIGTVYSPFFLNTKYAHMPMRAMTARKPSYNVKFLKMNRAVKHKTAIAAAPLKQNVDFFI